MMNAFTKALCIFLATTVFGFALEVRLKKTAYVIEQHVKLYDICETDEEIENLILFERPEFEREYTREEILAYLTLHLGGLTFELAGGESVAIIPTLPACAPQGEREGYADIFHRE